MSEVALAKGVGGFIIGYLVAKGVRVVMYILGVFLLVLIVLEAAGYIRINWERLVSDVSALIQSALDPSRSAQLLDWLRENWEPALGFIAGLGLGGALGRKPSG